MTLVNTLQQTAHQPSLVIQVHPDSTNQAQLMNRTLLQPTMPQHPTNIVDPIRLARLYNITHVGMDINHHSIHNYIFYT